MIYDFYFDIRGKLFVIQGYMFFSMTVLNLRMLVGFKAILESTFSSDFFFPTVEITFFKWFGPILKNPRTFVENMYDS